MPFCYRLKEIQFSSGTSVALPKAGLTLLVGPNNVGKSRCLREVSARIGGQPGNEYVVTHALTLVHEGTGDEFYEWLGGTFQVRSSTNSVSGPGFSLGIGGSSLREHVAARWRGEGLWEYAPALATLVPTAGRIAGADPSASYDAASGVAPSAPLPMLYADEVLEARISASFRRAFGTDLLVDRHGGNQIALRCGESPDPAALGGRLSLPFARAVRALPALHEQGDGMRSFVSCLLHTDVHPQPIVLIDEPEAFLHPPQARVLAQHIARTAQASARQVVVSTHSSDIVRGALDVKGVDVSVVRLTRGPTGNVAAQLHAADITKLWAHPILRASHLLDALFHQRLVLCEGDGDCRFYSAVLDAICEASDLVRPDVMFAHTGGKDGLPTAAAALRAVGVPIAVIADLDVLNAEKPLQPIWEALGGTWADVRDARHQVAAAVVTNETRVAREYFRQRVLDVLDASSAPVLDKGLVEQVRTLMRSTGGWDAIKKSGLDALPKGAARATANALVDLLATRGLHVVPVGELEGWLPSIANHGPRWVSEALLVDLARSDEAARVRAFVRALGLI